MLAASPPPVHPPFIGCSSSHQLPQLGSLQHIPCSGSDAEITPSHLQGCQLLSQASICLGGNTEAQQEEGTKSGEPRRQAGGHSATHHEIHGPLLATSSSAPRHLPNPIPPRPRHTTAPESGDDVDRATSRPRRSHEMETPTHAGTHGDGDDRVNCRRTSWATSMASRSRRRAPGNDGAFISKKVWDFSHARRARRPRPSRLVRGPKYAHPGLRGGGHAAELTRGARKQARTPKCTQSGGRRPSRLRARSSQVSWSCVYSLIKGDR